MSDLRNTRPINGTQAEQAVKTDLHVLYSSATALGTVTLPPPATVNFVERKFKLSGLGAETLLLTGSIDGTNYEGNLRPFVTSTGLVFTADALTADEYKIPESWPYQKFKFVKSSATATAVASFVASYYPKN